MLSPKLKAFRARWPAIFALLLWAQLVFSVGLMLWRYELIIFADWGFYLSGLPPKLDQLIEIADEVCPVDGRVAYLATDQYSGYSRVRYALYPRLAFPLSVEVGSATGKTGPVLDGDDLLQFVREHQIECLLVDDVRIETPISGRRHPLDSSRYIVVLSK